MNSKISFLFSISLVKSCFSRHLLLPAAALALVLFLSACGSTETPTNVPDLPKRGCNGCPNLIYFGRLPSMPTILSDFVSVRSNGDLAFQVCGSSRTVPCKLATIEKGILRIRDTLYIDRTFLGDEDLYYREIHPIGWSPYGADTLLVTIRIYTDASFTVGDGALVAFFNTKTDSLHLLYDHVSQRFAFRMHNKFDWWSEKSTSNNDTLYYNSLSEYPGTRYHVQNSTWISDLPSFVKVPSRNEAHALSMKWADRQKYCYAFLNDKPLEHLYVTTRWVRHWAWSRDSRYLATLWERNQAPKMPTVPDADTLPSDRFPCQTEEVAIFDMQAPKYDSLGRIQPNIRWNSQETLCRYANFSERIAFTPAGTLIISLADRERYIANLYEVTIDGRIVRQITDF